MRCSYSVRSVTSIVLCWLLLQQFFCETTLAERDTLSANILAQYWIDARDVLEQLDNYQALWVTVHGCV
jgi:hypothetical protein